MAKTIEENDFFSKKEKLVDPDSAREFTNIAVAASDGSTEISNEIEADTSDPQIQNIIAEIEKEAGQVDWKPAK